MSRKNFSKHHQRAILSGQVWVRPLGNAQAAWRVMAVAEGWVMGRYKNCAPGCVSVNDMNDWRLADQPSGEP